MPLEVRVYSDFVCPYCFVAERGSLAQLEAEFDVYVSWQGFVLHPEIPAGGVPVASVYPDGPRQVLLAELKAFAASFGVTIDGGAERIPNTRAPLAATEWARDEGGLPRLRDELMDAFWQRSEDIELPGVIHAAAERAGLDGERAAAASRDPRWLARVDAAHDEACDRGVTGIPTFFFGRIPVIGCQPFDLLSAMAERAGARRRPPAADYSPCNEAPGPFRAPLEFPGG